jgi:hypothetical protein
MMNCSQMLLVTFNLRCYVMEGHDVPPDVFTGVVHWQVLTLVQVSAETEHFLHIRWLGSAIQTTQMNLRSGPVEAPVHWLHKGTKQQDLQKRTDDALLELRVRAREGIKYCYNDGCQAEAYPRPLLSST